MILLRHAPTQLVWRPRAVRLMPVSLLPKMELISTSKTSTRSKYLKKSDKTQSTVKSSTSSTFQPMLLYAWSTATSKPTMPTTAGSLYLDWRSHKSTPVIALKYKELTSMTTPEMYQAALEDTLKDSECQAMFYFYIMVLLRTNLFISLVIDTSYRFTFNYSIHCIFITGHIPLTLTLY